MNLFFVFVVALVMPVLVSAKELSPPQHYIDKGACPFEGCTYREWTVNARTAFHAKMDIHSPIVFYAEKGENVTGLTGTVITLELGKAVAIRDEMLDADQDISVKPGDVVYVLNYVGEGYYKLWVNGRICEAPIGPPTGDERVLEKNYSQDEMFGMHTLKEPTTEWWVKVRNSKGQIGWTNDHGNFDHMDALE
jgi:hypothetical protein